MKSLLNLYKINERMDSKHIRVGTVYSHNISNKDYSPAKFVAIQLRPDRIICRDLIDDIFLTSIYSSNFYYQGEHFVENNEIVIANIYFR